jgi:hypothetical protein
MLKLLNKLVFGEFSECKRSTMVRKRLCDESGEMTHSCVMCVPVDSTDMGYQSLVPEKQRSTQSVRPKASCRTTNGGQT